VIFGLFGGKSRVTREPDCIWRRWDGAIRHLAAEAAAAERVIVVAHFRAFPDGIRGALERHGKAARLYEDAFGSVHLGSAAGHHFLPDEDERIAAWCEGLGAPVRLRFHDSLESAVLAIFNVANIAAMLDQLGLTDDEAIEHPFVGRAIRSAQEKIAKAATGARAADSPEEWMRLNLPNRVCIMRPAGSQVAK
jgi:hypothetical protein